MVALGAIAVDEILSVHWTNTEVVFRRRSAPDVILLDDYLIAMLNRLQRAAVASRTTEIGRKRKQ